MSEPYRVIVADPPWKHSSQGGRKGASEHYALMTNENIESYLEDEAIEVADNAVLFLWRVASMPEEALRVIRAWWFVAKTEIVWIKQTVHGKLHFGMGAYTRASHETCIIAIRGSCRPKVRNIRSVFYAPTGKHSEKPATFFSLVEQMYDGPRIELFARKSKDGWDNRGDEVDAEGHEDGEGSESLGASGGHNGARRSGEGHRRDTRATEITTLQEASRQNPRGHYPRRHWSVC